MASLKAKGQVITPENEKKLLDEIKGRYDKQTSPYYAAARLWAVSYTHLTLPTSDLV